MNPPDNIILLEFRSRPCEYYTFEIRQPALLYSVVARRLPDPKRVLNLYAYGVAHAGVAFEDAQWIFTPTYVE